MRGLTFIPSVLTDGALPKPTMMVTVEYHGEDLPAPSSLGTEFYTWKRKWSYATQALPGTPADALKFGKQAIFPNIHCILPHLCTLPVTT